ncbi:gem-associated protein 6 isoform X1 [Zootoca vivipara]|uniref:gem-associated protein 6 isoform X1 n=2 Tax=Zootoca vivipara TaxID=8524 RepID=UPI001590DFE9|nr:gem-associated protein 6 isoform X1 [Zootoca vivipara]
MPLLLYRLDYKETHISSLAQIGNMTEWQRKTPLEWLSYVNKEIEVLAAEKQKYKGWVLTVDPVSANILLANPLENGKVSISGILGHAVQDVKILSEASDAMKEKLAHLFMPGESQTYSQEELEDKKSSLKNWLEKNHIPVREQGESQTTLCVAGVLTIDPPYGPEDCNSSNEIILSRVQGLIQSYLGLQQ